MLGLLIKIAGLGILFAILRNRIKDEKARKFFTVFFLTTATIWLASDIGNLINESFKKMRQSMIFANRSFQQQQGWNDLKLSEELLVPGYRANVALKTAYDKAEDTEGERIQNAAETLVGEHKKGSVTFDGFDSKIKHLEEEASNLSKKRKGFSNRLLNSNGSIEKIPQKTLDILKEIPSYKFLFIIGGIFFFALCIWQKRIGIALILFFFLFYLFSSMFVGKEKTEASSQPPIQQQEKIQQAPAESNNRGPIRPLLNQPLVITLQPGEETKDFVRRAEGANWYDIEPTGKTKVVPYYQNEKGYTDGPGINPLVMVNEGPGRQLFKLKNLEDKPVKVVLTFRYVKK